MKIIPYLMVPNALGAIELYKKAFGAELKDHNPFNEEVAKMMQFPEGTDLSKTTMHAEISIKGQQIYLSDTTPGDAGKQRVDLMISPDSEEMARSIFASAEAAGFKVSMKLEKQFWGALFGRLTDPYGIGWQLNYFIPTEKK